MGESFFCSIIIPTIGRSTLERAVFSALNQDFSQAEYEVIVVNDSGHPLEEAEWQSLPQVQVLNTNRRERCFARNSGAAVARGDYLGFLDDDDWFLPGAIEQFWQLSQHFPEAVWLYGGIQVLDGKGNHLAEINSSLNGCCFAQIMGGAWAPLQASLLHTQPSLSSVGSIPRSTGLKMKT
jgi:glycosyltransferase involved in cell wall biosynthesis